MRRLALIAGIALLLTAPVTAPAHASTLPRVDFAQGQTMVSVGLSDASVDVALTDRLSLGASVIPLSVVGDGFGALRATYRLGDFPRGGSYGLTLSAGVSSNFLRASEIPVMYQSWQQLALNIAVPLGEHVTFRWTAGPLTFDFMVPNLYFMFWPNAELAFRLSSNTELTLGGNSALGIRSIF